MEPSRSLWELEEEVLAGAPAWSRLGPSETQTGARKSNRLRSASKSFSIRFSTHH